MGETLGMVHHGAKFFSVHRPVKLENKLSASKIQDSHGIDIAIPKLEKEKKRSKEITFLKQFTTQKDKFY